MKLRQLIVASLAALVASATMGDLLVACDLCRGRTPCRTCATSNEGGLLDALNLAAERMQPRLPRVTLPRLPSLDAGLRLAFGGGRAPGGCGCEINAPNCGCELREPSCGCESPQGCDCQEHYAPGNDSSRVQGFDPVQTHPHSSLPYAAPMAEPQYVPGLPSQPVVPHLDEYRPAPLQQHLPGTSAPPRVPESIPVPDNQVDPFRDDTATRVRQIPSRTIQYRQPEASYRQNFDPQASNRSSNRSIRASSAPASRLTLDDQTSSRSRTTRSERPRTSGTADSSAVVTAAAVTPHKLSPGNRQSATPLRTYEPVNPLRGR